jgi:hypothetical protein
MVRFWRKNPKVDEESLKKDQSAKISSDKGNSAFDPGAITVDAVDPTQEVVVCGGVNATELLPFHKATEDTTGAGSLSGLQELTELDAENKYNSNMAETDTATQLLAQIEMKSRDAHRKEREAKVEQNRDRLQTLGKQIARDRAKVIKEEISRKEEKGELLAKLKKREDAQNAKNTKFIHRSLTAGVPFYSRAYMRRQIYPVLENRMTKEYIPNSPSSRAAKDNKKTPGVNERPAKTKEQHAAFWQGQTEFLEHSKLEHWRENMEACTLIEAKEKAAFAALAASQAHAIATEANLESEGLAIAAELAVEAMLDKLRDDPHCFDAIRIEVQAREEKEKKAKKKQRKKKGGGGRRRAPQWG